MATQIIVISGPSGAGKSAVAEALCERFDRMVHVEVDDLRHWVKAGYRHPWAGDHQAQEQLELAVRNACAIARECVALRYAVVITDVALPRIAALYRELLAPLTDGDTASHLVTLLPSLEVALRRDAGRDTSIPDRVQALHREFTAAVATRALPGAHLDTTHDADARVTADRVQDAVARGLALLA